MRCNGLYISKIYITTKLPIFITIHTNINDNSTRFYVFFFD